MSKTLHGWRVLTVHVKLLQKAWAMFWRLRLSKAIRSWRAHAAHAIATRNKIHRAKNRRLSRLLMV
jgi:hypothetical protein